MRLFRVAKQQYIEDFSGEGARLYGGRWNKRGTNMLYFSTSLSLCVLEILVHFNQQYAPTDLYALEADVPDKLIQLKTDFTSVETHIQTNPPHFSTQQFGTNWVNQKSSLGLMVPSAIVPSEYNVIINPRHQQLHKLTTVHVLPLQLDARLFA